ncbi:SpoIIE family protein phosphatase [Streptomyces sp. NPDC056149]|uniref:SpoIIE family protein phosphatase n=1 Tax=Streptomyces sp. NPDC056149 TaxID=3345728 RepID=UPI0035DE878B
MPEPYLGMPEATAHHCAGSGPGPLPGSETGAGPEPAPTLARIAFAHAPGGIALLDTCGYELITNPRWETVLCPSPAAGVHPWTARLPAELRRTGRGLLDRALVHDEGQPVERLFALPGAGGQDRSVVVKIRRTPALGHCVATAFDVTDELAERQQQLSLALHTASLAAWSVDLDSGEERWFDDSEELYGMRPAAHRLVPRIREAIAPEHREAVHEAFAGLESEGDQVETTFAMLDDEGRRRWMRVDARVHPLSTPPHRWLVGVTRDVTDEVHRRGALEETARREADRADRIEEIAAALVSASTADAVGAAITESFPPAMGAIGALVLVAEHGHFRSLASSGAGTSMARILGGMPLDAQVPAARVIQDNRACYIGSPQEHRALTDGDPHDLLSRTQARSWAMLPLSCAGRPSGVLALGFARWHDFPPGERALLSTVAGLTGQALARTALVQDRVELAQAVQHLLMPSRLSQLAGLRMAGRYVPACDGVRIGGDWYDAFPLADGRYALCVGDVEGHDVRAAAVMGQIRTAVRAYSQTESGPGAVLAKANDLLSSLGGGHFATCSYLVLDAQCGRLEAATAGHVPGVVGRADGTTELLAPPPGPPLGVQPGTAYVTVSRPLTAVRTLVLLSDGLVEGPELDLDEGMDRVRGIVAHHRDSSPEDLADALLSASARTGHLDDAALLVVRRGGDEDGADRPTEPIG